jgi:hypothetical protein
MSNRADLKPQITVFQILTQKTFFVCEPSSGTSPQTTVPYIKHKLLTGTNDPKTFSTKRKKKNNQTRHIQPVIKKHKSLIFVLSIIS